MAYEKIATVELLFSNNSREIALNSAKLLAKLCNNIIEYPDEKKYRRVKLSNPQVINHLLPVDGAMQILFDMGFVEDGEFMTFPENRDTKLLVGVRDLLVAKMEPKKSLAENTPSVPQAAAVSQAAENSFFLKLKASDNHVSVYENPESQKKARSCVPPSLADKAAKAFEDYEKNDECNTSKLSLSDIYLVELLSWFKNDFFKWVDTLPCSVCTGKTLSQGMLPPTADELRHQGNRVENHFCHKCNVVNRFPRYNDPVKLLETRRGRCGEWANCFALIVRAAGYDVRYVLDWTDHVWNEVYSESQKRWIHCDPCENVCDKPLLYEAGWGKKLTYVIAFSVDDIQDVTWRYSCKHSEIRSRRNECREIWLLHVITKLKESKQLRLSEERKRELKQRLLVELCEFLTLKEPGKEELHGRSTGSLVWRTARGEVGKRSRKMGEYMITPTESEVANRLIILKYSCSMDQYVRETDDNKVVKGWENMIFEANDVQRKVESDWKQVYLSRTPGSAKASLMWTFDLSECGLVLDKIEVHVSSTCFEDGRVNWHLCGEEHCAMVKQDDNGSVVSALKGESNVSLSADMRKGQGDNAWQHTQLFRQAEDDEAYPLRMKLFLMEPVENDNEEEEED